MARKNVADLLTVMRSRNKKWCVCMCVCVVSGSAQRRRSTMSLCLFSSEEKNSFFNNLFGKRKGHTASLEPPRTPTRLCRHTNSFNSGETH